MPPRSSRNPDLLRGTLEVLVLKALSRGRRHGFGIARWIEHTTDGELHIEEGSLYPALHRLRHRGLIEAEWSLSETKRRARYYELTEAGRLRLRREATGWNKFAKAVAQVLASG